MIHRDLDLATRWTWAVNFMLWPLGKSPWCPLARRLDGSRCSFWHTVLGEKNPATAKIWIAAVQLVASQFTITVYSKMFLSDCNLSPVSAPQSNVMDLANLLDETADVFIFEPGSAADALILRFRLHNATICSLACFTIIVQDVADDRQEVFCICWQCLHQLSQVLYAALHCNCALWQNEMHFSRFLGLFKDTSI